MTTVLSELAEKLDPARLASLAPLSPIPWAQRLGYLLERVSAGGKTEPPADYVAGVGNETTPPAPERSQAPSVGGHFRWALSAERCCRKVPPERWPERCQALFRHFR